MKILGIDTSCDDTCISIIKSEIRNPKSETKRVNFEILSNVISSQTKLHAKYGGVYPFLAKREHQKNLPMILKKALKRANFSISNFKFLISKKNLNNKIQMPKIDLIAVTIGPGLEPCLWQGVNFAKNLAEKFKKPLIPVNHIEAHILANFVGGNFQFSIFNFQKIFPAVCLVVSGGHTQLILMKEIGKYKLIGETRDDAAGECFDKVARILGLEYPGGPAIEVKAAKFQTLLKKNLRLPTRQASSSLQIKLPRPMIYQKNYDFSFSGLKTAVLYQVKNKKRKVKSEKYVQAMAAEIQQAIIDVLIYKTLKAAKNFRAKTIILGGGVAANEELRRQFKLKIKNLKLKINFFVPEKILCTDNAAMIAITAYFQKFLKKISPLSKETGTEANLKIG